MPQVPTPPGTVYDPPVNVVAPSAAIARRIKAELARSVLRDLAAMHRDLADPAVPDLTPLVDALQARAEQLPEDRAHHIAGPELFRTLAATSWGLSHDRPDEVRANVDRIPEQFLGRLIAVGPGDQPIRVNMKRREHGVRLRQAERWLTPAATNNGTVEVEVGPTSVDVGGARWDRAELASAIDGITDASTTIAGTRMFIHHHGDDLHEMLAELNRTASQPVGKDQGLTLLRDEALREDYAQKLIAGFEGGARLLAQHRPDLRVEVETMLDGITLVTGDRFVGGSDIWYQGIAVLNPDPEWSPVTYSDHLVHEGAHLLLHALNELHPVLANPHFVGAPSPIREDPRPMWGILHSVFVFMRLVLYFQVVAPRLGTDETLFRQHRHLKGFYDGMASLDDHAEWTPSGAELFSAMRTAREVFKSTLPDPDPRFYKRVGKDYVV